MSKGYLLDTNIAIAIIATAMVNQLILVSRDADMVFAEGELSVPKVDI